MTTAQDTCDERDTMQPSDLSVVIIQHLETLKVVQAVTQDLIQNLLHHAQDHKKVLSELHRQKFRSLSLCEVRNVFEFGQLLEDYCQKWLLGEDCDPRRIVERVVMEQFLIRLPEVITNWVQHHNPATLIEAIHLAESHPESLCLLTDKLKWTDGSLFKFGQLLEDYCLKWLLDEDCDPRRIVERVVMEQFVNNLPQETAQWVQQHQPTTLIEAVHLAENHLSSLSSIQHLSK